MDFGPIVSLMIPAITGIGYGAGLAHLVIPPDPAICLTTIIAYLQMRKGKCNTSEDCCLTVVCTSLVAHILTGSWQGWLNDTYFLLTAIYTISALIPILLGPNFFVTFQQISVPGIPILARNLVFAIYGQEFPVWAVN
ncbi:hypothetical protein CAEBREN_07923 [Caenorhabditis brenneri]|uniref:Uncharacterized protein n=1 Tax=Caenorhabditis brenneri TaxID=135651 RepID=G0MMD7_CAEBE|nr:hypothetical protein CAEBREN_07923 [Caenorhabditis brenneri]